MAFPADDEEEPHHMDIDDGFWKYVQAVIFVRYEQGGRAPLIQMVNGIRMDDYLLRHYGYDNIEALLGPIEADARVYARNGQVTWVNLKEMQERCYKKVTALHAPAPSMSLGSTTDDHHPSTSPPKRHKLDEGSSRSDIYPYGREAGSDGKYSTSPSPPPPQLPSAQTCLLLKREEYARVLERISKEYSREDEKADQEREELNARTDGVLAAFGEKEDAMTQALEEVQVALGHARKERQKTGAKDLLDRQAELKKRMEVDQGEVLAKQRFGTYMDGLKSNVFYTSMSPS